LNQVRALLLTTATPDDTKALACARCIRAAGGQVDVAGDAFWGQAYWSRAVRRRVRLPHPKLSGEAYVAEIGRLARRHDWNVALPLNDYTMGALVRHDGRLPANMTAVLPEAAVWDLSRDKLRMGELAASLGIQRPRTFCPKGEDEAAAAASAVGYPCVVKLRSGCGGVGRRYVRDEPELRALFRSRKDNSDPVFDFEHLLVQERICGEQQDVCIMAVRGEPRALYMQRKVRTWPVDGGRVVIAETIENPALREAALTLLRALHWHGPVEMEFCIARQSGDAYLLDVNGRFWGGLGLALAAGLDLPSMYCRIALDGDVEPRLRYPVGVRYRWPLPFFAATLLKDSRPWRVAWDFLGPRRATFSDLSWRDPLPALAEVLYHAIWSLTPR